jgi:hypothetical protein
LNAETGLDSEAGAWGWLFVLHFPYYTINV